MNKVLVMCSGGLDSALLVKRAIDADRLGLILFVDCGQTQAELEWLAILSLFAGLECEIMRVDAPIFGGHSELVPFRNPILAAIGVNRAVEIGAREVWLGPNLGDQQYYTDCWPSVAGLISVLAEYLEGVSVLYPLSNMTRGEISKEAEERGVDISLCWSCNAPVDDEPCGRCLSCRQNDNVGKTHKK